MKRSKNNLEICVGVNVLNKNFAFSSPYKYRKTFHINKNYKKKFVWFLIFRNRKIWYMDPLIIYTSKYVS